MDSKRPQAIGLLVAATVVAIVDAGIKQLALAQFPAESALQAPGWIALAVHKNYGIAFDIPFKLTFVVILTAVIGVILLRMAARSWATSPITAAGALIICIGAAGNLFDRLVHGFTVDYLIIASRSAINLSDLLILLGVGVLLFARPSTRPSSQRS